MVNNSKAVIAGNAHATPPSVLQDDLWQGFFREHFGDNAIARRMFKSVGVSERHAVVNPLVEDVTEWSTEKRMQRFLPEALPLATTAVNNALNDANLEADDIGLLAVVSCTGYVSPGLDTFVPIETGMNLTVQRINIGHMGCHAALPGLSTVTDFVIAHQRPAVLLSVELPSLHVQPPTNDTEQIVAHALFSDAAAAVVVKPNAGEVSNRLEVVNVSSSLHNASASLMTWDVTNLGFRMGLSQKIPDVLEQNIAALIDTLLAPSLLSISDIAGWAVHPGGPRILDVVQEQLKLDPEQLAESRAVLDQHGNCSSATVLLVLDQIRARDDLQPGDHVVAVAFGPGLTLYAVLLRCG